MLLLYLLIHGGGNSVTTQLFLYRLLIQHLVSAIYDLKNSL